MAEWDRTGTARQRHISHTVRGARASRGWSASAPPKPVGDSRVNGWGPGRGHFVQHRQPARITGNRRVNGRRSHRSRLNSTTRKESWSKETTPTQCSDDFSPMRVVPGRCWRIVMYRDRRNKLWWRFGQPPSPSGSRKARPDILVCLRRSGS
jgi:hypothetical protein